MKKTLSACIISRQHPHLDSCLNSIKDHVDQICVVINDNNDSLSIQICEKYQAKYLIFTECNDENGNIADFSLLRNKSLELADSDYIFWIDSDDLLDSKINLKDIIQNLPDNLGIMCPYEYSYDTDGHVICRQYRERIAPNHKTKFLYPVHEVMISKDNETINWIRNEDIIFKHQRQFIKHTHADPGRNLRILEKFIQQNPNDIRNLYYLGLEYSNVGNDEQALKYLIKYTNVGNWKDELAMAYFKISEIYERQGNFKESLFFAHRSIEEVDWFESYYIVARQYYHLNNWKRCVDFARLACEQPETNTALFINQNDRYMIHIFLNHALNNIGQIKEALASCNAGLVGLPNNPILLNNKRHYERFLGLTKKPELLPLDKNKLHIIMVGGPALENWDPETIRERGNGGSETMLANMAHELVKIGHQVTVYAQPNENKNYDGVEYRGLIDFHDLSCDVLVVSRYANFLSDEFNINSRVKLLWCHDIFAHNATNKLLLKADKILALSEWHKQYLMNHHNLSSDHVLVTRNGIDLTKFKNIKKKPYKCINSSSPDRSWPVLLDIWPRIVEQIPEAELHLYYGFDNWKKTADSRTLKLIDDLEQKIKNSKNVFYHGRVNENQLIEAFNESTCWLYPTWFSETSCISAMQARAANCYCITSPIAALNETLMDYDKVSFIEGEWTSSEYQDKFVKHTIKALKHGSIT